MPYDPTGTVPVCLVALNSPSQGEQTLYDVARYDVRPAVMSNRGAVAPVVFGGKIRSVDEAAIANRRGVRKVVRVGDSAVATTRAPSWAQ